jgi:hypothetical protein
VAHRHELIARTIAQIPDLRNLEERLREDPTGFLAETLPRAPRSPLLDRGPDGFESLEAPGTGELAGAGMQPLTLIEAAASALSRVRAEGPDARLTPTEAAGFEAIVLLVGRPAILIQDGRFFPPPQEWARLEGAREEIERVCRSVGRIEVTGHPGGLDWVGTGVLVGEGVLMTNRHVAKEFCTADAPGHWRFESGMTAAVDYSEELGATTPREFALEEVIGVHDRFDMALFRVSPLSRSGAPPEPLAIGTSPPASLDGHDVYVVGYPASDSRRNDPVEMRRIFAGIFDVKRLQPGTLTRFYAGSSLFDHDCSTLGGNSGSAVVDLKTHRLIGLHFEGRYMDYNRAVALWPLAADPLLKRADVHFDDMGR